jgi:2-methylcitrate dehydratase PrpD
MCEKCVDIDKKIKRYRDLLRSITDQRAVDEAQALIADLVAQKAAFIRNDTSETSRIAVADYGVGPHRIYRL